MTPTVRLNLVAVFLLVSAVYAVIVVRSPAFAHSAAIGYIAALSSVSLLIQLWKKP